MNHHSITTFTHIRHFESQPNKKTTSEWIAQHGLSIFSFLFFHKKFSFLTEFSLFSNQNHTRIQSTFHLSISNLLLFPDWFLISGKTSLFRCCFPHWQYSQNRKTQIYRLNRKNYTIELRKRKENAIVNQGKRETWTLLL